MSDDQQQRGRRWIDLALCAGAAFLTIAVIVFEVLHIRVAEKLQGNEAGCLHNLRVLSQAMEFLRLDPAAKDGGAITLDTMMARVLLKEGNVVEVVSHGRGTVVTASAESNGTVKIRFEKSEQDIDPRAAGVKLVCPAGGQYDLKPGQQPRCTVANHSLTNAAGN
ncbi:MAG: hypothetical protein EXS22_07665 [Pedosphaera sp.]|nr:hypothetical protein [Pedosphaera sp.]MSU43900.1 hypothetical protein [Pedosphaera sp.]